MTSGLVSNLRGRNNFGRITVLLFPVNLSTYLYASLFSSDLFVIDLSVLMLLGQRTNFLLDNKSLGEGIVISVSFFSSNSLVAYS